MGQYGAALTYLRPFVTFRSFSHQKVSPIERHPGKTRNSENTEMYVAHPFRVYGLGKPNMADAQVSVRAVTVL